MKPLIKKLKTKPTRLNKREQDILQELEERLLQLEEEVKRQKLANPQVQPQAYVPSYNFQKEPLF